jgi:hypothetical protein
MIPKIRIKREQTSSTFVIDGSEARRAFVTSLIPSFLEIILSGLRALKALRAFNACKDCRLTPLILVNRSIRDATTTKASNKFQYDFRYGTTGPKSLNNSPLAMILIVASMVNKQVKILSQIYRVD